MLLHPVPEDLVAFAPENPGVLATKGIARNIVLAILEPFQDTVRPDDPINVGKDVPALCRKLVLRAGDDGSASAAAGTSKRALRRLR